MSPEPLAWLFGLEQIGIKFGLETIATLVDALGHPERAFRTVHVAGTNGKGSVTAMVDAALCAAGHRSARYTSPHLLDLTERFVVEGRAVDRGALADVVADIRDLVADLCRENRLSAPPTFFEVTTAAAFELFRRAGVEVAVCEVGLGGRLDATNVIAPMATAITSIGIDHQRYLGDTLREIALEKAGIIKPGVPVVVGRVPVEAREAIGTVACTRHAEIVDAWTGVSVEAGPPLHLRTPLHDYGELRPALAGAHQLDNAVTAVRLLETIGARGVAVSARATVEGLARVHWPGRLDLRRLPDGREALLDAAHNVDGALALAAYLRAAAPRPLVLAAMRDKDAAGMLRALAGSIASLVVTRASNRRSAEPADLAALAREVAPALPVAVAATPAEALALAWRQSSRITVAGSIFLLGDVIRDLGGS